MYITCPKCSTKFTVVTEQIGIYGRKVKCSKCSHIWHQKPIKTSEEAVPNITQPTPVQPTLGKGINLPALLPTRIQPYLYVLPIVMISVIIFMLVVLFPNNFGTSSILNSNALAIRDINIDHNKKTNNLTVNYKILNNSVKVTRVPLVRIRLVDHNNRVIKSIVDNHTSVSMQPNQFIQVKTDFTQIPPSTASIDIMIGNKLDFILR